MAGQPQKPLPIPLPNEVFLRIKGELIVLAHDFKENDDITFRAKTLIIRGVDLLVQGKPINAGDNENEIEYKGNKLILPKEHSLIVKGGSLSIDGIRASNIERVEIQAPKGFKTLVEFPPKKKRKHHSFFRERVKSIGYSLAFFGLMVFMAYLTWLPFAKVEQAIHFYGQLRQATMDISAGTHTKQVNTSSSSTNAPDFLPKTETSSPNGGELLSLKGEARTTSLATEGGNNTSGNEVVDNTTKRSSTGTGAIAFLYFGTACLLYVLFYLFVAFSALAVCKGMRRHNKLTRNQQSIINALEKVHDKEVRKAMQRKLLDDMLDTYLENPSSEA